MTRTATEIGRGLVPARPPRAIVKGERIHVIGAAGAGASAAALLAARAGARVTACDTGGPSTYTAPLEAAGIPLDWQHSASHVRGSDGRPIDRLAVTKALTAVNPDHPELVAARDLGVPMEAWQQVVADAAFGAGQSLLAVAGTHGKSTTSGWLVHLLVTAGLDPSAFVGALLDATLTGDLPATVRSGSGRYFVVEADEYAGNFDPFLPDLALLLTAEWDHPDVFADEASVLDAFEGWLRTAAGDGRRPTLVANVDDRGVAAVVSRLAGWRGRLLTVSLKSPDATIRGQLERLDAHGATIRVEWPDRPSLTVDVGLPGAHNAANAMGIVGTAFALGIADAPLAESLARFHGVGRRMELKGDVGGVVVLDDYGHHPTAIARTLETVREVYPGRRTWAVYEPLTFHRTAAMLEAFADVLATADEAAIIDIWPVRDPDTTIVSAADLARATSQRTGRDVPAPGSPEATADVLATLVRAGDVVLVMGGGRSYVTAERLVELLRASASRTGSPG
jgi:UDP-N-acetylmuramate--alanine ligase